MRDRILAVLGLAAVLTVLGLAIAATPMMSSAQPGGRALCARHPQNPHCRTPSPTPTPPPTTSQPPPSTTTTPPTTPPPPTTSQPPPSTSQPPSSTSQPPSSPTPPVTTTPSPTPTPNLQPVGDPLGRAWTPVLDDEFSGTSIDTSKWVALNGWGNNNVTSNAKNCTESGGNLVLALPGDGTGCDLYSSQAYGAGANARALLVGDYLEARIFFPGPGTAPTSTLYNWPAFWAYDGSGNWLGGENDIAEALNHMEYNYTSSKANGKLTPTGSWGNSWHVYGIYRAATSVQVFYDGVRIGTITTSDDAGPESIMFTSGRSNTCCGAPTQYGPAGNVLVDWVRDWH
jgi:hypothetical protein